jgi:hypothetical protein
MGGGIDKTGTGSSVVSDACPPSRLESPLARRAGSDKDMQPCLIDSSLFRFRDLTFISTTWSCFLVEKPEE